MVLGYLEPARGCRSIEESYPKVRAIWQYCSPLTSAGTIRRSYVRCARRPAQCVSAGRRVQTTRIPGTDGRAENSSAGLSGERACWPCCRCCNGGALRNSESARRRSLAMGGPCSRLHHRWSGRRTGTHKPSRQETHVQPPLTVALAGRGNYAVSVTANERENP